MRYEYTDPKAVMDAIAYLEDGTRPVMPSFHAVGHRNSRKWRWMAALVWLGTWVIGIGLLASVIFGLILIGNGIDRLIRLVVR